MISKEFELSPQEPPRHEKEELIVRPFTPGGRHLSEEDRMRLRELADRPDSMINTEDIPELPPDRPYIFNPYVPASARLKKAS